MVAGVAETRPTRCMLCCNQGECMLETYQDVVGERKEGAASGSERKNTDANRFEMTHSSALLSSSSPSSSKQTHLHSSTSNICLQHEACTNLRGRPYRMFVLLLTGLPLRPRQLRTSLKTGSSIYFVLFSTRAQALPVFWRHSDDRLYEY